MGFVLNERGGQFLRLTPNETDALHECLQWGRQPGNNKVLEFFGTTYESFHGTCRQMMERFYAWHADHLTVTLLKRGSTLWKCLCS